MKRRVLDPCCGGRMMWFDKSNPIDEDALDAPSAQGGA